MPHANFLKILSYIEKQNMYVCRCSRILLLVKALRMSELFVFMGFVLYHFIVFPGQKKY